MFIISFCNKTCTTIIDGYTSDTPILYYRIAGNFRKTSISIISKIICFEIKIFKYF